MAMPASGTVAIISAPQTCGSICAAVQVASGSLLLLSQCAGKSGPHGMTEFYGYAGPKVVTLYQCSVSGTIGVSTTIAGCWFLNISPAIAAGECFFVTFNASMGTVSQGSSAIACFAVYCCCGCCGGCLIGPDACVSPAFGSYMYSSTAPYALCVRTTTTSASCAGNTSVNFSIGCVCSITGSFIKGTPNTCCVYTG